MAGSQEYSPPQKKNRTSTAYKPFIRKFPGPAGLSPDLAQEGSESMISNNKGPTKTNNQSVLTGAPHTNLVFSKPCYQRLVEDFHLSEETNPLNQISLHLISKIFSRKAIRDLRVPFLGLLVSSVSADHGVSLKLMDTTFEVNSVVHQEVWDEIGENLEVNSAIALMQVPVITSYTTHPPISLFISRKNILRLYKDVQDDQTEVKIFNRTPQNELRENCAEFIARIGINMPTKTREIRPELSSVSNCKSIIGDEPSKTIFEWNPDDFLADLDFADDFGEMKGPQQKKDSPWPSESLKPRPPSAHNDEGNKSDSGFVDDGRREGTPHGGRNEREQLSQTEKLMVQEVLSGIEFGDFV
ncbi:hypothetical protein RUM44_013345 [Polyplax serrata]|uniref:Homologous recombination OB-fold protein OB-fold domain-containing protein n=1 Tax=Polyplax serrata TaxID=468196 RepID=A0ABR1BI83_POLSC